MNLQDAADKYLYECHERVVDGRLAKTTYDQYERLVTRLVDQHGTIDLSDAHQRHVLDVISSLRSKDGTGPAAYTTKNTALAALRSFFKWANEEGYMAHRPCRRLNRYKPTFDRGEVAEDERRQPLERWVADYMIEHPHVRTRTIVAVALHAGLRVAELTDMTLEDWLRPERLLRVRGKGRKYRRVSVSEQLHEILTDWTGDRTEGPMWPSSHSPFGLSKRRITEIISDAAPIGQHCTPHQLRHTFASNALAEGATIEWVRNQLGHSSIAVTSVYVHAETDSPALRIWYGRQDQDPEAA